MSNQHQQFRATLASVDVFVAQAPAVSFATHAPVYVRVAPAPPAAVVETVVPALAVTSAATAPWSNFFDPTPAVSYATSVPVAVRTCEAPTPVDEGTAPCACPDLHCAGHDRILLCAAYRSSLCGDQCSVVCRRLRTRRGSHHR